MYVSKLSNRIPTYRFISESGDGVVDGILEFVGWVAVKWTLPVYPGIFAPLMPRVRRRARRESKIIICEIVIVTGPKYKKIGKKIKELFLLYKIQSLGIQTGQEAQRCTHGQIGNISTLALKFLLQVYSHQCLSVSRLTTDLSCIPKMTKQWICTTHNFVLQTLVSIETHTCANTHDVFGQMYFFSP